MKKLALSLLVSCTAVAPVQAQESDSGRIAPEEVYEVAPGLGSYTDEVLFGRVWPGEALAPRDRSLVVLSALIAMGQTGPVDSHTRIGLENGLTPAEIGEIATHLAFYAGWPYAISAVYEMHETFEEQGVEMPVEAGGTPLELDPEAEEARKRAVAESITPVIPQLGEATDEVLFADLWRRPTLSPRDRSLVTVAALAATGKAEQLSFHLDRAMDNGLTRAEAEEAIHHLAYYAGWPNAVSTVSVVEDVFAAHAENGEAADAPADLTVVRGDEAEISTGDADKFTGTAEIGPLFSTPEPARLGGGVVRFEAGAHTAWHTHPLGQTLYITEGCGWVQVEDQPVREVAPGDIVVIPSETRHWHGASASQAMSHLALSEALDGTSVTWMERLSEEDYARSSETERVCSD
ncbi:carboxymuconolactone decarboxylase family protein [Fodinicurvata halophila]|uniref:Carboxymuconolactone decarboxylase family protein n=1 Tax=Fodinicurvata halophila TaxID=1419723 RepID=A0ABV8UM92_9PROT